MRVVTSRLEQWLVWHLWATLLDESRSGKSPAAGEGVFQALLETASFSTNSVASVLRPSVTAFAVHLPFAPPEGVEPGDVQKAAPDADVPASVPDEYRALLDRAARQYGLDPRLLAAVVEVESGFRPDAVSPKGAKGLMQLTDATARAMGVSDPFDPAANVMGGAKYLSQLIRRYGGDVAVALAAYNAGPGRIDRAGVRTAADLAARAHLLPQETIEYVQKVWRAAFASV